MPRWHDALRAYRRRSLEDRAVRGDRGDRAKLMFVLCSDCCDGAELASAFEPAVVLQTLGGIRELGDASVRATFEFAIREQGVEQIVICGHHGCRIDKTTKSHDASQAAVVAQCKAARNDDAIGPMLSEHRVVLRGIWFDEPSGDVYACDLEGRPAAILDDEDIARMLVAPPSR